MLSWSSQDAAGAFNSPLKLTLAGGRANEDGALGYVGIYGIYRSSTPETESDGIRIENLFIGPDGDVVMDGNPPALGISVRCIKD